MANLRPYESHADGLKIRVRLRPKAAQNAIDRPELGADGRVRLPIRVTAVPESGKANRALIKLLAKALKAPASAFTIIAGGKSRDKILLWRGNSRAQAEMLDSCSVELEDLSPKSAPS